MLLTVVMFNHRNISEVKQWFSKWGPRPPGGPGAECRGSAMVQPNIEVLGTFKKKESRIIEFSLRIHCIGRVYN